MKEGEFIESMFACLSKIIEELKAVGKIYPEVEHIRRILRSLPPQWHAKVVAIESINLNTLTYDEVRGDLIAFEKTNLNKWGEENNSAASKAGEEDKGEEEIGEDKVALITISVVESFRRSRTNRRERISSKGKYMTNQSKNGGKCYDCEQYGHSANDCPEAKKNYSKGYQRNKTLNSWGDENNSNNENDEMANICFMAIGESRR